jgi:maleylacetate reductase
VAVTSLAMAWVHTGFAQRLHFGDGALSQLGDIIKELGARHLMLVTTEGRAASEDGQEVARRGGRSLVSTFSAVSSHLPTTTVEAAVRQARRDGIDGVVSFGGGSCMDLGKALVYFTEQQSGTPGASYADRPALVHIAIPTTYSGAEVTPHFGMTDEHTHTKTGGGGPTCAPIAVVYDPRLTLTTPVNVTAETSLNALAHCVEATYATRRSPEAQAIALAGARRITGALPLVVDDPSDLPARTALLEGAALAGRALQNASMGVHHAIAQQLGPRAGISHGLANAVVLPHAIRFNYEAVPAEMALIGEAMGDSDDPAGAVERLVGRVGLATQLRDHGVTDEDIAALAAATSRNPLARLNPRPVTEDDARAILQAAW